MRLLHWFAVLIVLAIAAVPAIGRATKPFAAGEKAPALTTPQSR